MTEYDLMIQAVRKCNSAESIQVLHAKAADNEIMICGEVNPQNTKQNMSKKNDSAVQITTPSEEVFSAACKLVYGEIPKIFYYTNSVQILENALVRTAQLKTIRR